ncbi:MAG: cation diffusion facilitator family transporter [bacterium]
MHDQSGHNHGGGKAQRRRALAWAFGINAAFLIIEVAGGVISGSLALLADAGHMLSDVAALGVALWVSRIVERPPSQRRTYGYGRAEVLSGLLNGLTLLIVVTVILHEAVQRIGSAHSVDAKVMLPVAIAGLIANVVSAAVLMAHRHDDLNVRAAFLHLAVDAAGSVAAIAAGIAIYFKGWELADVIASILIGVMILGGAFRVVRESVHILLEGTPPGLDLEKVRHDIEALEQVQSCHDLHVWLVGSGEPVLTAHLIPSVGCSYDETLRAAHTMIATNYEIEHTTFQVEGDPCQGMHE